MLPQRETKNRGSVHAIVLILELTTTMFLRRAIRGSVWSRHLLVLASVLSLSLASARPALAQKGREDFPKSSPKVMAVVTGLGAAVTAGLKVFQAMYPPKPPTGDAG